MSKYRLKGLAGVAVATFVLVNTHAPDIADAAQFKPVIQTPSIIVRPPNVTPQSKRLLKKKPPSEVTNPAATQGGSAAESDSPVRRRNRATAPIPRARPNVPGFLTVFPCGEPLPPAENVDYDQASVGLEAGGTDTECKPP